MSLSKNKEALIRRLGTPRTRSREGLFVVEGIRCTREFLGPDPPLRVRFGLVSPRLTTLEGGQEILDLLGAGDIPLEKIGEEELARVSDTETSQGILLVVEEPGGPDNPLPGMGAPRILLLDGIQDPGNVGTLIRSARAFGLDAVVALDGTTDPWAPKVVRASAGSVARIPVVRADASRVSGWLRSWQIPLLTAAVGGRDVRQTALLSIGWALALGNEGSGLRRELEDLADEVVSITMAPGVDSLNVAVAGSILLFSLTGLDDGKIGGGSIPVAGTRAAGVEKVARPALPGDGDESG